MHELCSDWHAPYAGSIAPYSLSRGNPLKFTSSRNIHSWICAARRLHARTSVTSYTSVNIYNCNSRLAHFNALWMEYIRSLRTGIMAEYSAMSTSLGTYVRIERSGYCRNLGSLRAGTRHHGDFSVMGTSSLQPFLKSYWLTPVKWLANCRKACKYGELETV